MQVWSETEVVCDGITLSDRRVYRNSRAFTSLLRPLRVSFTGGGAESKEILPTLRYLGRSIPGDGVEYNITITEACIYHLPGGFGDLTAFVAYAPSEEDLLAACAVALRVPFAEYLALVSQQGGIQAGLVPQPKPAPGPRIATRVSISKPHYVLVEDACNVNALAVVLRCDASICFESDDPLRYEFWNLCLSSARLPAQ